jgi:hypothetical protein
MKITIVLEPPQSKAEDKWAGSYVATVNGNTMSGGPVFGKSDHKTTLAVVQLMRREGVLTNEKTS